MNLIIIDHPDESQPAIDTLCDNCGAIYDLLDCITSAFGKVLCPECSSERSRKSNNCHSESRLEAPTFSEEDANINTAIR